jgi:hypothetical protein
MINLILWFIGIAVLVGLFLIGYRQTIGSKKAHGAAPPRTRRPR